MSTPVEHSTAGGPIEESNSVSVFALLAALRARVRAIVQRRGSLTVELSLDTSAFDRAMEAVRVAALEFGIAFRRFAERLTPKPSPSAVVKHSFCPDYDLRCMAPRCDLLAEEH